MSKLFAFATFALMSVSAFAAPNACLNGIVEAKNWSGLTAEQIECIEGADIAKESLVGLCSPNRKTFSSVYKIYREYEIAHLEAFQAFQAAVDTSARMQAQMRMRQIDRDWKLFGFKNEVDMLLGPLWSAKTSCETR